MAHDPLVTNNFIDSCSFDPKVEPHASASEELLRLADQGLFQLNVPHSVVAEIDHPNTPVAVKSMVARRLYTLVVELNAAEQGLMNEIHRILTGNAKPESMLRDAQNVFEAQKYGGHFITNDKRVLARAKLVYDRCGLCIVTPTEFLAGVKKRLAEDRQPAFNKPRC